MQDANKPDEMSVQSTPHFLNDQTIPVVESLTTISTVKATIEVSSEDDHQGVSIQVDETEVTRATTSLVLEAAGQMAVETSEVVKETHIEVDQEPKSHANGVEMQCEVDAESKREKHAHPMDETEMEIENKKLRLNNSGGEEPAASDTPASEKVTEQTDPLSTD